MLSSEPSTAPRLKILRIIASMNPDHGGPVEGIVRQSEATAHLATTEVVSLDEPRAPYLARFDLRIHALGAALKDRVGRTLTARIGYTPRLIPWLNANIARYDAAIVDGLWNYATWGAARVLPKRETPHFVFTHGMMDPWFRRTYPVKHAVKQGSWLANEGPLLTSARAVFFTCEEERRLARGQFWGQRYTERVVGFGTAAPPPATQTQMRAFAQAAPRLGERPYLLFLSRVHPKKGCDLLIEAFAEIAASRTAPDLVIAGPDDNDYASSLKDAACTLGIAHRVHWTGMLQGEAKWGAFHNAEAFILPSHQENFGIAVAEALGCAKPVLISDKVNIWREISAAGAGLVASDDRAGALSLLTRFLALAPDARARMSAAARRCFETHFDVAATAPSMLDEIMTLSARSNAS